MKDKERMEIRMRKREVGCVRKAWAASRPIRRVFQRAWRRGERCESGGKRKAGPRTSTQREAGLRRGDPKQREREVPKKGWEGGAQKYGDGARTRAKDARDETRMKVRDEDELMGDQ
jgi:hypothetical protein